MSDLSVHFTQLDRIAELEKQLASQIAMKHKAMKSRDNAMSKTQRTLSVVLKMQAKGLVVATDAEIAESCFVSKRSVMDARYRLIKAGEL